MKFEREKGPSVKWKVIEEKVFCFVFYHFSFNAYTNNNLHTISIPFQDGDEDSNKQKDQTLMENNY